MIIFKRRNFVSLLILLAPLFAPSAATDAQEKSSPEILAETVAARIVPTTFYFAGQSAPTQIRYSAVVRLGKDRHVIAGMVDTSVYSSEISDKYEGF